MTKVKLAVGAAPERRRQEGAAVVSLFPSPRGRPKKPAFIEQRCTDDFETVAAAIVGIASARRLWSAAKLRARSLVDLDRHLRPTDGKVFQFLLEHVNPKKGRDWHGVDAIAEALGVNGRTVQKAFERLSKRGHILRTYEILDVRHGCKLWSTTLPTLVKAGVEMQEQQERKDTPKKGEGHAQKSSLGHAQTDTLIYKGIKSENEYCAAAGAAGAVNNKSGSKDAPLNPRFDQTAPLRSRVTTWRYADVAKLGEDDKSLYDRWRRAAGNVDRDLLIDEFCRYYRTERTYDAQLELVRYAERRRERASEGGGA